MNCFHVQCMPQGKVDTVFGTEVCNPVPGKNALNADYNIFSECVCYEFQIFCGTGHVLVEYGFTKIVDDTDIHSPCMQVDSNVKLMLVLIESH